MEGVGNDVLALIATGSLATAGILAFYYYYFFFPHPQSRPTSSAPQQHEAAVSVSHPQPQPSEKDVVRETEPVRNTRIPEIPDQQRAPGDITITFKFSGDQNQKQPFTYILHNMSTTISDLISAAFKPEDLRENTVTLFFRGEILNPNRRISSYALSDGCCIIYRMVKRGSAPSIPAVQQTTFEDFLASPITLWAIIGIIVTGLWIALFIHPALFSGVGLVLLGALSTLFLYCSVMMFIR